MQEERKTKGYRLQESDTLRRRVCGLKQSAEGWSGPFDATSGLMFVQDKDFKFVAVTKSVCDLLKVNPGDFIDKKCYEVLHKSDKPWPNCPLAKALKDKRPHTGEVYDPNIGIPLLITASPLFDEKGELTTVVHVATDITERNMIEEAQREGEEQHRAIFEGAVDGIIHADRKRNVIEVNPAFTNIMGIPREEVVGKNATSLAKRIAKPEYVPHLLEAISQMLKGVQTKLYELEINDKIVEVAAGGQQWRECC
jgi:PAS domain S-box-containing protein